MGPVRQVRQDLPDRPQERPIPEPGKLRVRRQDLFRAFRGQEPERQELHLRSQGAGQQDQPGDVRVQSQIR